MWNVVCFLSSFSLHRKPTRPEISGYRHMLVLPVACIPCGYCYRRLLLTAAIVDGGHCYRRPLATYSWLSQGVQKQFPLIIRGNEKRDQKPNRTGDVGGGGAQHVPHQNILSRRKSNLGNDLSTERFVRANNPNPQRRF